MTFFERQMRRLFADSGFLSEDTIFSNKVMVSSIGKDLRAKVEFAHTHVLDHYDALKLSIINRTQGVVDSQVFKFRDIIGLKNGQEPHIWDDNGRTDWYMYKPTSAEFESIQNEVEEYIGMFADQEIGYEGHTMGGM